MNKKRTRERICIIANKNKRLLIKENVFLDLFAMVFEEHNLKKGSIMCKNEHNFSIIWPKKSSAAGIMSCFYYHNL